MRTTVHTLLAVPTGRRAGARRALAVLASAAVVLALLPAVAQAVPPSLTATSTVTTKAAPGASTALEGLSVTDSNAEDILQVTVSTDVGTLSMAADPDGLTLAFGNNWAGDSSITFSGLPSDINSALGSVELQAGDHAGETAQVSIAALVSQPGYVYSPANEHFYEYVPANGITWDDAYTQASLRTLEGQQGYLATIPDSEVNDLVASKLEGAQSVWFGARADQTPDQPVARTWRWAAGPLAGQIVSKCSSYYDVCDFVDNAGLYSNWAPSEPNNYGGGWYREGWYAEECWMSYPDSCWDDSTPVVMYGGEDAAVTNWGSIGFWNDLPRSNPAAGYVVEYGDLPHGDSSFEGVATDTSPVSIEGPPLAPTGVEAQHGDSQATLTFAAADGNGSPVTGYETLVSAEGGSSWSTLCSASPCTVPDLVNGQAYGIKIRAINANGPGTYSESVPVTPSTTPGPPTGASAERGDRSATVSFDAPVSNGGAGISGYTVTSQPDGHTASCLGSPCLVDGLDNGTSYAFTVHATNLDGASDESDPTAEVVPAGVPTAPTNISAVHGNGSATVSFNAPDDNGSPITGYSVTSEPGGSTTCDASPCVIAGLTNGTSYTFTVHAVNDIGTGEESDASEPVTPATVPDAPAGLSVTRGDEQIDLSFDAPVSDGGSPVTGYEYSLDGGESWHPLETSGTSPVTGSVLGLSNGTEYTAAVRALNAEGHSAASIAGQAMPARVPDAPTGVSATRGDGEATVSFNAGAANGSAITGHTVIAQPGGAETSCPASPCVVSGLTNGTSYTFRIVTTNDVGTSDPSGPSNAVTPAAPPGAPGNVVLTSQDGAALLSFDPADTDPSAPVTEYEVSLDDGHTWETLTTNGSGPITSSLTGLANGTAYTVLVRARNELGAGDAGPGTNVTPAGRPGAARGVTATPNGGSVLVTWTAPHSSGGSPVTGYTVTASPGGASCTVTGTSCTVTGLVPGSTYTFTVVATNAHEGWVGTGAGAGAASSRTLVPTRAGPPRSLRALPGDRTLTISWTRPVNQGGSSVVGYAVSIDGGRNWRRVRPVLANGRLSTQVVAVRNGAPYSVMVRALNAAGAGAGSEQALTRTRQWFHDPLSAATRSREVGVPRRPNSYRGPLRHTTATARSHDGTIAMPATTLFGRKLQSGQAASFGFGPLFAYNSTVFSAAGRTQVKSLVRSLTYVKAVTCEGFADYGGRKRWEARLAKRRAVVVCQALRSYGANVATSVRGYGSNKPVTIGGTRAARAPNRRVVVRITRG